jgi:hypothetical protein
MQQSAESGRLQFYRNRQEPVPWITRAKHGRIFRRPRTTNERRAYFSNNATEEIFEPYGAVLKLRQKRKWHMLPNAHDDLSLRYQRNWKEHRGIQRKNTSSINRRIHSPPLCGFVKPGAGYREQPRRTLLSARPGRRACPGRA